MKHIILASLLIILGASAGSSQSNTGYAPNDGKKAPGTFTSPGGKEDVMPKTTAAPPTYETDGVSNSEMNPSPNPAPNGESKHFDKTLTTEDFSPLERQAEEEKPKTKEKSKKEMKRP